MFFASAILHPSNQGRGPTRQWEDPDKGELYLSEMCRTVGTYSVQVLWAWGKGDSVRSVQEPWPQKLEGPQVWPVAVIFK